MGLRDHNILLGISGGIAAYKTPQLVRDLAARGARVQPVLTHSAREFVTPATLQAVAGVPVRDTLWDAAAEAAMGHIELARWADALLIAPATAHCMAQLAQGTAGDLLTTLYLAFDGPVFIAPAMNQAMWGHRATQRNRAQLEADGVVLLGPAAGEQACGDVGPGRMVEPQAIAEALDTATALAQPPSQQKHWPLAGTRVLVTAGPTREALDPVRYISNRSSGKQGFAVAEAAAAAGAEVTLVCGPTRIAPPAGIRCIDVVSAEDMYRAVHGELDTIDVFIGVAAVADYRPEATSPQKIKKTSQQDNGSTLSLRLIENPDIIASVRAAVADRANPPLIIGFAAETENTIAHARAKLERKGLDLIVVNDVSRSDIGFSSDDNATTLITAATELTLPKQSKRNVAERIVEAIVSLRASRSD
ncbi:MAG: bifunctional phosphopantothenoylcysteine decarboxylase/phosphopantothenate--cysteine ligase CoaBC [Pseudomonadota bacterium]